MIVIMYVLTVQIITSELTLLLGEITKTTAGLSFDPRFKNYNQLTKGGLREAGEAFPDNLNGDIPRSADTKRGYRNAAHFEIIEVYIFILI